MFSITEHCGQISGVFLSNGTMPFKLRYEKFIEKQTKLLTLAANQLKEYFENKRKYFDLPLRIIGTEFEK